MYNDTNVQPEINNTGHGGSNSGESGQTQAFSPHELPSPVQAAAPSQSSVQAVPTPVSTRKVNESQDNHWVPEVEQLFDRTMQNPRQRAEEFSELRRRYQQDELGIKPTGQDNLV